jgi:oligosaccharide repeat unit polymerase
MTISESYWLAFLASLITPVMALMAAFWGTTTLLILSPSLLFAVFYIVFIHIGGIMFFIESPGDNFNFLAVSSTALFFFSIGTLSVSFPAKRVISSRIRKRSMLVDDIIYLMLGWRQSGTIPIIQSYRGFRDVHEFIQSRIAFTSVPGAGYFSQFYGVILPLGSIVFLLRYIMCQRFIDKLLFSVLCGFTILLLVAPGHRAPLLFYFITILTAMSYYYRGLNKKMLWCFTAVVLFAFSILTLAKFSGDENVHLFTAIKNRVFKVQALGPQFVYQYFPEKVKFQRGEMILADLMGILPGRQEGFSTRLPELRGKKSHNNPIGSIADIYINFGLLGVMVFMFLWGAIAQWIHIVMIARTHTVTRLTLMTGITMAFGYSSIAGIVGVFFQFGIFTIAFMAIGFMIIRSMAVSLACNRAKRYEA